MTFRSKMKKGQDSGEFGDVDRILCRCRALNGSPTIGVSTNEIARLRRWWAMRKQHLWLLIGIVVLLAAFSILQYQAKILQAREAVLQNNLVEIRNVIQQYTQDK